MYTSCLPADMPINQQMNVNVYTTARGGAYTVRTIMDSEAFRTCVDGLQPGGFGERCDEAGAAMRAERSVHGAPCGIDRAARHVAFLCDIRRRFAVDYIDRNLNLCLIQSVGKQNVLGPLMEFRRMRDSACRLIVLGDSPNGKERRCGTDRRERNGEARHKHGQGFSPAERGAVCGVSHKKRACVVDEIIARHHACATGKEHAAKIVRTQVSLVDTNPCRLCVREQSGRDQDAIRLCEQRCDGNDGERRRLNAMPPLQKKSGAP